MLMSWLKIAARRARAVTERMLGIALTSVLAALASGCGGPQPDGSNPTFPLASYLTLTSDSGNLTVEVRTSPDQPFQVGGGSVQYLVRDRQGLPVDGLTFNVTPWMPAMGHGASVKPTGAPSGGGAYVISGVSLYMAGLWELRTSISGAVSDSLAPSLDVE
jgi:YtkA-like